MSKVDRQRVGGAKDLRTEGREIIKLYSANRFLHRRCNDPETISLGSA